MKRQSKPMKISLKNSNTTTTKVCPLCFEKLTSLETSVYATDIYADVHLECGLEFGFKLAGTISHKRRDRHRVLVNEIPKYYGATDTDDYFSAGAMEYLILVALTIAITFGITNCIKFSSVIPH